MTLSARAQRLLEIMRNPDPGLADSDGWIRVGFIPFIGRKTAAELERAGLVEFRPGRYYDDIRIRLSLLIGPEFGDLWIE